MNTLILYGMRWSGKTTIWKLLSEHLWYSFYDLDKEIEKDVKMNTSEFVGQFGWDEFRRKEYENLKKILQKKEIKIISLWWWTPLYFNNQELLNNQAVTMIFIDSPLEEIQFRIQEDQKIWKYRNSLTNQWIFDELWEVFQERYPIYNSMYNYKFLNNKSTEECVHQIINTLNIIFTP